MGITILENLTQTKKEFVAWLETKEKIISEIDIKDSMNSDLINKVLTDSVIMQAEDRSVNVFVYETGQNLYMLNCNLLGEKIKHEVFPYKDLSLKLSKGSLSQNFLLSAKNGWYYRGKISPLATEQLRELALKRQIPLKEVEDGKVATFLKKYFIFIFLAFPFLFGILMALWRFLL